MMRIFSKCMNEDNQIVMRDLRWVYNKYSTKDIKNFGIENGMMGYAISAYILSRETNEEDIVRNADSTMDRITAELSNSSSLTIRELSEIGCGLFYLIKEGYLVADAYTMDDMDIFFRKRLQCSNPNIADLINIGAYFSARMSRNISIARTQRDLLKCQELLIKESDIIISDTRVMLEYFSLLIGFFQFNIFRFRTINLFLNGLYTLQTMENKFTSLEYKCCGFIILSLMENKYIYFYLQEHYKSLYEWTMRMMQYNPLNLTSDSKYPEIIEMDEQIYLIPDKWHCILLLSDR